MKFVEDPFRSDFVIAQQRAYYFLKPENVVNGQISTLDMYAEGILQGDAYLIINQIVYISKV